MNQKPFPMPEARKRAYFERSRQPSAEMREIIKRAHEMRLAQIRSGK